MVNIMGLFWEAALFSNIRDYSSNFPSNLAKCIIFITISTNRFVTRDGHKATKFFKQPAIGWTEKHRNYSDTFIPPFHCTLYLFFIDIRRIDETRANKKEDDVSPIKLFHAIYSRFGCKGSNDPLATFGYGQMGIKLI